MVATDSRISTLDRAGRKFTVASVVAKGHVKRVKLDPGPRWFEMPKSACLNVGNEVYLDGSRLSVHCEGGTRLVLPSYVASARFKLGALRLDAVIKEITDAEEQEAYEQLADLHYRGHVIYGRTARLIVRTFDPAYPLVIGFIELATPFFMNKPRAKVLDAPFRLKGVEWDRWDIHTLRENIHRIVRIARTVVAPEFRGFGIGTTLVEHAAEFANTRWQVGGKTPFFLEISADMLKFVPFVQQAGMRYVGETDGNLKRVAKDMSYLIGRFGDGNEDTSDFKQTSGILDQQVTRMKRSMRLMRERKLKPSEFFARLDRLSEKSVLKDFDLFRGIVSLPKPTFMKGLNLSADRFIEERTTELNLREPVYSPTIDVTPFDEAFRVIDLTATYSSRVRRTVATHAIQQAFDISPADVKTKAIRGLTLEMRQGDVILVEGPSGSGKTTLLKVVTDGLDNADMDVEGRVDAPTGFKASSFKPIRSRKSLIELFGEGSVHAGLQLLALAGISEPNLYLKRFQELSNGQQYRAQLAGVLASGSNVWVVDEFCANLDEITANLVAHNVQKVARRYGLTLLVAASNPRPFIRSLKPDRVVRLSSSTRTSVMTGKEYVTALRIRARRAVSMQRVTQSPHLVFVSKGGSEVTAIYQNGRRIRSGFAMIRIGENYDELVEIVDCTRIRSDELAASVKVLDEIHDRAGVASSLNSLGSEPKHHEVFTIVRYNSLSAKVADCD